MGRAWRLLLGLEVVEQDGALLRLLTPVLDDDTRAVDDLASVALAVDLACNTNPKSALGSLATFQPVQTGGPGGKPTQPSPLAQLLAIGHLDQRDLVLAAQRHDQLLVGLLLARLVQHAHVSLAAVQGLGGLAQAAREPVVDQGDLEDALEGVQDGHAAGLGIAAVGCDLDLVRGLDLFLVGGLFSVRL